jgi:hypothetical protein
LHADTGSFDYIRRTPHSAQDDNEMSRISPYSLATAGTACFGKGVGDATSRSI